MHTPGPWKIAMRLVDGGEFPAIYRGNIIKQWGHPPICDLREASPERDANARLIAAAPDLLAALQFYATPENWHRDFSKSYLADRLCVEPSKAEKDAGKMALEAIRKAIGE